MIGIKKELAYSYYASRTPTLSSESKIESKKEKKNSSKKESKSSKKASSNTTGQAQSDDKSNS